MTNMAINLQKVSERMDLADDVQKLFLTAGHLQRQVYKLNIGEIRRLLLRIEILSNSAWKLTLEEYERS
jgi:hypothetical protein